MDLNGTIALVTGANRGLGARLVDGLLARGAGKVYAAARQPNRVAAGDHGWSRCGLTSTTRPVWTLPPSSPAT